METIEYCLIYITIAYVKVKRITLIIIMETIEYCLIYITIAYVKVKRITLIIIVIRLTLTYAIVI